jgi:hypothetical protein
VRWLLAAKAGVDQAYSTSPRSSGVSGTAKTAPAPMAINAKGIDDRQDDATTHTANPNRHT